MADEMTTIQVSVRTKDHLDKLKIHGREPYEDVIVRMLEKVKSK